MEFGFVPACVMLHVSFLRSEDATPDQRRCWSHKKRQSVAGAAENLDTGKRPTEITTIETQHSIEQKRARRKLHCQHSPDCAAVGRLAERVGILRIFSSTSIACSTVSDNP